MGETRKMKMSSPLAKNIVLWLKTVASPKEAENANVSANIDPVPTVQVMPKKTASNVDETITDQNYTHFCLNCEENNNIWKKSGTNSPCTRVPVNMFYHQKSTGHHKYSELIPMMSLPLMDLAYSQNHGTNVRVSWKTAAKQSKLEVDYFSESRPCKIKDCTVEFSNPVDAFKHIRDNHLPQREKRKYEETVMKVEFPEESEDTVNSNA